MPNEELTYRDGIERRLDSQATKLDEILVQTRKTNGRVSKIEIQKEIDDAVEKTKEKARQDQMKLIRNLLYAVATSLSFVVGSIVVPIITAWIQAGH